MGLFRPFIPNLVNSGKQVHTALVCFIHVTSRVLKGFDSNESWSWRLYAIRFYARNLFPIIIENKEFPHSYKKIPITNIYIENVE